MRKSLIVVAFVVMFFALQNVFAQVYELEFQQVYDKVVVKEKISENNYNYIEVLNLEESDGRYFFTYRYNFPKNYSGARVVFLIDNYFSMNEIFPKEYYFDENEVVWNVSTDRPFAVFLKLEKKANYGWIWIVVLLVLIFAYFKLRKKNIIKKKSVIKRKEKINYTYLLNDERKIIEMLKKSERNEMWQNNITRQGNFSKAKTSRLIRNLESRGLVKKISFGNTNKIVLK